MPKTSLAMGAVPTGDPCRTAYQKLLARAESGGVPRPCARPRWPTSSGLLEAKSPDRKGWASAFAYAACCLGAHAELPSKLGVPIAGRKNEQVLGDIAHASLFPLEHG